MYWQCIEEVIQKTNVSAYWFTRTSRSPQPGKKFAIEVKRLIDHHKIWTVELWTMCLFWARLATSRPLGERSEPFWPRSGRPRATNESLFLGLRLVNLKYTMNTALNHQKNLHLHWTKFSACHAFHTVIYNLNRTKTQARYYLGVTYF